MEVLRLFTFTDFSCNSTFGIKIHSRILLFNGYFHLLKKKSVKKTIINPQITDTFFYSALFMPHTDN